MLSVLCVYSIKQKKRGTKGKGGREKEEKEKRKSKIPVNAVGEGGRLIQREARSEERGVVEHPDDVFDCLVALVCTHFLSQRSNDRIGGVDFKCLYTCVCVCVLIEKVRKK